MILGVEPDLEVVGEASDGAAAIEVVTRLRPDVVLMDVQMPGTDGIEATREIVARDLAKVVILTTFDHDDYLVDALRAGASGFLLKNAGADELIAAVRVVAAGDALLAPEVTRRVIERFAAASVPVTTPVAVASWPLADSLTDREAEVLRLVAQARSNAEIARELYIGEATVKTHVSNVLQKLGARDRVHAAVLAHQHGLI
jgi:DNA-binding NarL/FixJ family response regulator